MSKCELCGSEYPKNERPDWKHRKLFVLFKIGFENWEPKELQYKGVVVRKNRDKFRKDIMVWAGHADPVFNIDGSVDFVPHSLKYSKAKAEKFEAMYQDCLAVIADRVLRCGNSDLHDMIMMEF